jgi:hypothetical protein
VGLGVAGVALVAWLVAGSLDGDPKLPAGTTVAAATSAPSSRAPTSTPTSPAQEPAHAADLGEVPGSVEAWEAVVTDLYQRRAQAFVTASAASLSDVYTAGSDQLAADEAHAAALAEAGEALRGFAPEVVEVVSAGEGGGRAEVQLVDRWTDYEVVRAGDPVGPAVRTVEGRAAATVRLVLVRTESGWRIETGERLG